MRSGDVAVWKRWTSERTKRFRRSSRGFAQNKKYSPTGGGGGKLGHSMSGAPGWVVFKCRLTHPDTERSRCCLSWAPPWDDVCVWLRARLHRIYTPLAFNLNVKGKAADCEQLPPLPFKIKRSRQSRDDRAEARRRRTEKEGRPPDNSNKK